MSNLVLEMSADESPPDGPRHRVRGWVAILLSLGVLLVIGLLVKVMLDNISFLGPPDYAGPGEDPVVVVVQPGQTVAEMGQTLKAEGVVASVDAWLDATNGAGR